MSLRPFSHGQRVVIKHEKELYLLSSVIAKTDVEIFLLFYSCSGF